MPIPTLLQDPIISFQLCEALKFLVGGISMFNFWPIQKNALSQVLRWNMLKHNKYTYDMYIYIYNYIYIYSIYVYIWTTQPDFRFPCHSMFFHVCLRIFFDRLVAGEDRKRMLPMPSQMARFLRMQVDNSYMSLHISIPTPPKKTLHIYIYK
jgi:hypothetical protein